MTVYLMNGGKVDMSRNISGLAAQEITSMEHFNASLVEARTITTSFLAEIEATKRLNKPTAIRTLQKSLKHYEGVINTIKPHTEKGWLRYYYKTIEKAAASELEIIRNMFKAILSLNNGLFNKEYQRYLALLSNK